jgi:hypothetical protein
MTCYVAGSLPPHDYTDLVAPKGWAMSWELDATDFPVPGVREAFGREYA